jgi:uroporphyrin-III C-methyltransferase
MSSRIRREIVSALPPNLGPAVARLGDVRKRLYEEDIAALNVSLDDIEGEEEEDAVQPATFNQLVTAEDKEAARNRRMRWLSQICEYWPLKRLCSISDADVAGILAASNLTSPESPLPTSAALDCRGGRQQGAIILAGSGPGNPELLTMATLSAIKTADLILADKLVPSAVLDLIPRRTVVHIARKFPGNAEAAQDELLELGLAGVKAGKIVLRLKQGDPYLFGRGGEEVLWFRQKGWNAIVLPGITSALSAPLFAAIPVTQRAVSDQVLICTGTGRAGKAPPPPEYVATRTVVFLMALHRLSALVESLVTPPASTASSNGKGYEQQQGEVDQVSPSSRTWPLSTPCTIVERASCRDQRVIRSTLQYVCQAVEELGSLPPGLLVVGNACGVLNDVKDRWTVEEGFSGLESLTQFAGGLVDGRGAPLVAE